MHVLLLLAAAVALVGAAPLCLSGEAALVPGASAPLQTWCNHEDCTLRWRLSFDTATVGDQRWPLEASINGTALTALWPALTDVGIQCSTSGELIATTATAPGGQRLRLVWTYAGVSSFSCTYMLGTVDRASDFRNFQALLAYSGHIASFDATLSSQAPEYSLAAASVVCDAPVATSGAAPTPSAAPASAACVIGGCRYTPAQWRGHRTSPVWQTVTGRQFCSISYADIVYVRNQAKNMPVHWLREAQLLVAADMDAALYGCALPTDTNTAIAVSLAYISNPLNCALNVERTDVVTALNEWTDGAAACTQNAADATTGHVHHSSGGTTTEQSYLIWAVVMTVAFGVVCLGLAAMLILFARPIFAFVTGGGTSGDARSRPMGDELGHAAAAAAAPATVWSRIGAVLFGDDVYDDGTVGIELSADSQHVPLSPMATMTKPSVAPVAAPGPSAYMSVVRPQPAATYASYVPGGMAPPQPADPYAAQPSPYSSAYY